MKKYPAKKEIKIMGWSMLFMGILLVIVTAYSEASGKPIIWLTRIVSIFLIGYGFMHVWKVDRFV